MLKAVNQKIMPNVRSGMRHKKKLFALIGILAMVTTAYACLPKIVERAVVGQAAKRGWTLTAEKMRVEWFAIDLTGVSLESADGTKRGKLNWVHVKLNRKLGLEEVTAGDGSVTISGAPSKSPAKERSPGVKIRVENVDVDWKLSDDSSVRAKSASFGVSDESTDAKAKSIKLEAKLGSAEIDDATLEKTSSGMNAQAKKAVVFVKDARADLHDIAVNKLVAKPDHLEISSTVRSASLPRDLSASGIVSNLTVDTSNEVKVHFDATLDSVSGQYKSVSKGVVATSQISAEGDFETKAFVSDQGPVRQWDLRARVKSGKASVKLEVQRQKNGIGEVLWNFSAELEPTPCQSVLEAIPEAMRTELDGAVFDGNMEGMFTVNTLEEKDLNPFAYVRLSHHCKVVSVPTRISDAMAGKPFRRHIYTGSGDTKEVTSGSSGWTPFGSISPYMAKAVVTTEDPGFWGHHGFDMEAIRNSLRDNVKDRKFTRGASTIPMQLAKNMFLSRDKTATRKLQEFFLTIIVDQKMTKDRILEAYLNLIEFGPDVYGIGAASHHYFGAAPSQLSLGQSVFLASILPRPRATYFNPDGELNAGKRNQIALILDLMVRRNSITEEEARLAKEESMTFGNDKSDGSHGGLDTSGWEVQ